MNISSLKLFQLSVCTIYIYILIKFINNQTYTILITVQFNDNASSAYNILSLKFGKTTE